MSRTDYILLEYTLKKISVIRRIYEKTHHYNTFSVYDNGGAADAVGEGMGQPFKSRCRKL